MDKIRFIRRNTVERSEYSERSGSWGEQRVGAVVARRGAYRAAEFAANMRRFVRGDIRSLVPAYSIINTQLSEIGGQNRVWE